MSTIVQSSEDTVPYASSAQSEPVVDTPHLPIGAYLIVPNLAKVRKIRGLCIVSIYLNDLPI